MEVMKLLAMFRGTIPKDREKMDLFLRYQAQHFDEKWQDLVESFLTEEGKIEEIPHVYSFHQDIISFLEASSENNDQDLESYTRNFGQAGLSKLSQLSSWEKNLVLEVATYNLSTRFYIQSEKEKLEPLSELVFHQNQDVNLVNVYRVANNLSDRVSRDIEEFLLMVDSKELKKEVLEIHFEEKEGDVLAYLGSELMATLDTVTDLVHHEENYTQLPLTQKLKIITHFDDVKARSEKSNQVEEVLSPSSDIEQETEETNSFSNVDKIVEEALREYPIGSQVSYKGQVFQLVSIENAQLNDLVRLELFNDSNQLFEENPILYLNSLEEIEQVLSLVELEKEDSDIEMDSSSESQEIDLFSYLEEDNEKDKETETLILGIEETDVPVQDFVFPDNLEDFYPKTNREKIETNIATIELVKRLEKEGRQANPEEQELLAKYVGWGGLANEFFDELNPKYETERLTLKSLVSKIDRFVQLHLTDEEALDVYKSEEASKRGKYKGLFKKTIFYESPLSDKDISRIKGMVDLRETYQALIEIQRHQDYSRTDFQVLLSKLNRDYDRFVSQFGYLNASVNRNLFDSDDKYSLLASLEDEYIDSKSQKVKYKKSLAFEKALVRPERVIARVSTALDALNSSLSDGRGVDLDYMVSIYPEHSQAAILDELGDQILMDPESYLRGERKYLSKNQFLSGDILNKIEVVQLLVEENNQDCDWSHALDLLESVRPPRIHLADIEFKIGSRWIPQSVYGKFAFECFTNREFELSSPDVEQVIEVNPVDGQVHLRTSFAYRYPSAKDSSLGVSGSRYDTGRKIFENLLNSNQPTITMTVTEGEKKKTITDLEKTSVLRAKEQHLQELFQDFVSRYPDVQQVIEESYNRLYNRTVSREYDGSHLVIDGLAQNISLRPHQENAIQRIVEEKRALLAHEVGSGKTLTMLGAGFKLKELGMVHKPLYVVPSSLSAQFGQEIMKFFPTKKVFVTTKKDFVKARRKQFVSRIITGDYDAIVIGDSQFEKIPVSKERQMNYIEDKLNELREIKTHSENKYTVKEAEQSISGLEKQLEELQRFNRDSFIDFENLGIDFLFVDEAHHFKNIRPITGLGNVAGITNTTSKKNVDMEMKVRQIQEEHDFKNIVFATGTPVSNSISELYTMMNYIQPDILKRYQVDYFDSWVGAFGEIQNSMELAPTGDKYQPKKRFKKFVNLPELMKIYKETADIQTQDMLDLPVPEAHIIPIESELTENQKLYLEELVMRSDMVKCGTVDPSQDNMLKITGEARKLAIDMRLLDSSYSLADNHKLLQVVDNVERIYREGMENKATQMIFSDIGTPKKKDNGFDVYSEIKALLVDRGIPSKEIAFVHDANSDEKKNSLSRKVNAGEVRILLASTEKGGTGLNVQSKMKAVHHLDVPWRPSDIQQRNGRIIRQGNENKEVDIYHYITKGSFDNYLWATQENKLRYIKQIMTSKEPIRAAEDIDEQTMTASDFKALATGNPYLKYKMELENDLTLLENQRRAFQRSKDHYRHTISYCEENMPILEKRLSKYEGDIQQSEMSKDQAFSMTVGKQAFEQRAEAGESLHRLIRHNQADSKEFRTLASYRGFDIKMLSLPTNQPLPETFSVKIVGENQYSVSLDLYSPLGTIQRLQHTIDHIKEDQVKTQNLLDELQDKLTTAKVEIEKNFPKEEDYQTKKAEYDVLSPLIETETDLDIIDQALRQFHEKGKERQEQLSFELD
ncbi:SNF2-related protein [Streptococcus pneumoniae]|uniref:SNF2 family protein n=2 Tax=Streptococcus pneumoniae TaxID=1313 RepID=A0ABC9KC04_STREE|nr:SNF2-related protein [Streptococcus pneumoniae]MDG8576487.1 DEAD/DEAH box helicase family protein [Streptococcus pneumoniae]MDT5752530.1 DEAD/DEAH box helicase family protein [Streptococcus pneumoniae]CEV77493.1 SNF2 family protein [Streptococcus pneumoniae]CEV81639.1 SNF2 family protein [Streptococcus pneumoniae]CEV82461.1 SNF2 family protein [Streptococcus pneumoniae]